MESKMQERYDAYDKSFRNLEETFEKTLKERNELQRRLAELRQKWALPDELNRPAKSSPCCGIHHVEMQFMGYSTVDQQTGAAGELWECLVCKADEREKQWQAKYAQAMDQWSADNVQNEEEKDSLRSSLRQVQAERDEALAKLPLSTNRTRDEARRMLGPVSRHHEGMTASHGCVDVNTAQAALDMLIAENNALRARNDALTKALGDLLPKTCQRSSETLQVEMDDPLVGAEWKFQAAVILNARRTLGKEGL